MGYQAFQARSALVRVAADLEQVGGHLRAGEAQPARAALDSARREAQRADDATDGPTWSVASRAPVVGDDVEAVRTVAEVTRVLTDDVLGDVVTASETLDPDRLRPRNGRIKNNRQRTDQRSRKPHHGVSLHVNQ